MNDLREIKETKIISQLAVRDKKFHVVKLTMKDGETLYGAIDHDHIKDGKCIKTLNGIDINVSKELPQAIEYARTSAEFDYWIAQGYDKAQAFEKVFNVQLTDRAKEIMLSN